jgi:hypothetical protein
VNRSLILMAATGVSIAFSSSELLAQRGRGGGIGGGERIGSGGGIGSGERFGSNYSNGSGFTAPVRPSSPPQTWSPGGGLPTTPSGVSIPGSTITSPATGNFNTGLGNYTTQGGTMLNWNRSGGASDAIGRRTSGNLLGVSAISAPGGQTTNRVGIV